MTKHVTGTLEQRFWQRVRRGEPGECWHWQAGTNYGYGEMRYENRRFKAHRLAYELTYGPIPAEMCVCHSCDNPACCNPSHLFIGTLADNNRDKANKDRGNFKRGERHPNAKLTDAQIAEIRILYKPGMRGYGARKIARRFGVSFGHAQDILSGQYRQ